MLFMVYLASFLIAFGVYNILCIVSYMPSPQIGSEIMKISGRKTVFLDLVFNKLAENILKKLGSGNIKIEFLDRIFTVLKMNCTSSIYVIKIVIYISMSIAAEIPLLFYSVKAFETVFLLSTVYIIIVALQPVMAYKGYCNDVEFEIERFVELGEAYFCEHNDLLGFIGLLYEKANGALAIELKRAVIREKEIGILKALAEMKERVLREDNEFISVLLDENIDKSMAFKRLHEKIRLQNIEKLLKEFKRKYLIINLVSYLFTGVLILLLGAVIMKLV